MTTKNELMELLIAAENEIAETPCRLFPSSFNPNDPNLTAFPRPFDWQWNSCERILRALDAHSVMARLPLFWQIESPLNAVCRKIGAILFLNEPENMPIGAAAIKSVPIHTVICEAEDARGFSLYLAEKNISPSAWFLIHRGDAAEWNIPDSIDIAESLAQEVHLFPGMPVLVQCASLIKKHSALFHISEEYAWEIAGDKTYISSVENIPFPLVKFELPFSLACREKCLCGKIIMARIQ